MKVARRLSPDARRAQLAQIAQRLAARDGYAGFSLDEVAEHAGVTRNLVYRYFPRGRLDLYIAAIHVGGEELSGGWNTDPAVPIDERMALNFRRTAEAAAGPSDAWTIHRQARALGDPEVRAAIDTYLDRIVENIALNHVGTSTPTPKVRLAITSYLAFLESALDTARRDAIAVDDLLPLFTQTLVAAIAAARD